MYQNSPLRRQERRLNNKHNDESAQLNGNDDNEITSSTKHMESEYKLDSSQRLDQHQIQITEEIPELQITPKIIPFRNFIRNMKSEALSKKYIRASISSGNSDIGGKSKRKREREFSSEQQTDSELSQMSHSTNDESKTYSQVYSEICEETRVRQEKAEQIRRLFTNKITTEQIKYSSKYNRNRDRTARWVANLGQPYKDDYYTTGTSSDSDPASQSCQQSLKDFPFTKEIYQSLVQEQLDVIASYQNDAYEDFHVEEYMDKLAATFNAQEGHAKGFLSEYKKRVQVLDPSQKNKNPKFLAENEKGKIRTEVLQFEHCDVYQLKPSNKSECRSKKQINSQIQYCSEINSKIQNYMEKGVYELTTDCSEEFEAKSSGVSSKHSKKGKTQKTRSIKTAHDEELPIVFLKQAEDCIDSEAYTERTTESEANSSSKNSNSKRNYVEGGKSTAKTMPDGCESETGSLTTKYSHKKRKDRSNNSGKSSYYSSNSFNQSNRYSQHGDNFPTVAFDGYSLSGHVSVSNDDYYLSSRSEAAASSTNSRTRFRIHVASKKYQDRASSPIQIISVSNRTTDPITEEVENHDDGASERKVPASDRSTRSVLDQQQSNSSVYSEDKAVQYPSGDELEESAKSSLSVENSTDTDNTKCELHDIGSGDDSKTDGSSNEIGCNSLPSGSGSISSYEPGQRFYRRTQPWHEDDNINPFDDVDDDSEPLSYKKHVARLAERALRYCTNYYDKGSQLKPVMEVAISDKVQMIYNSEMQFQTLRHLKKRDKLLQQLNEQLQEQLTLIAPSFQ